MQNYRPFMKTEKFYLDFILDAIRKIENSLTGVEQAEFETLQEKQSAIILQLMLIGEVAKKLPESTKSCIDLPWKQIVGFRDVAIHNYTDINLHQVWNTAQRDVQDMKAKLQAYLQTLPKER